MRRHFRVAARAISMIFACLALGASARSDVRADRGAVAQRIGTEIASHSYKKVYVADFLDTVSGRIDKGCFFASVISTRLADQKQNFVVVNRIDGQRMLTKAEFIVLDLQKPETPAKVGAATGADAVVMGTFQQNLTSIVLEISLRDVTSGREVFHTQYQEQATDRFEALFPAAQDTTGTIFLFAGLDGITRPICGTCPHPSTTPGAAQVAAANQLLSAVYTAEGKLDQARVVRSADPTVDQAALEALQNWKAEPAKDGSGTPVSVRQAIEMGTTLNDPPGVLRAGVNGVGSPTCIYCPQPEYSDEARREKVDGTVTLDVTVLPDGTVKDVVVLKTTGHGFEEKAIETIKKWKLKPALDKEGNPVACRVNIEVTFRTYEK